MLQNEIHVLYRRLLAVDPAFIVMNFEEKIGFIMANRFAAWSDIPSTATNAEILHAVRKYVAARREMITEQISA